jgi:hypothetical protein
VAQRQRHELAALDPLGALEARDLDVRQREESVLGGVEVVGQPAAVSVDGKAQQAGDPVALGFDDDPLLTVLHARGR